MVPMRDGVKLHTLVFSPKGAQGTLPILFLRTPYGIDGRTAMFQTSLKELADDGYHLRLPGHPGEIPVGRGIRHDPSPARPGRPQGHRRGDRRLSTRSTG